MRGFTMVELIVAAGILSLAIVSTADLLTTTGETLAKGTTMANLDAKANELLARVERELLQAGLETLLPATPAGDSTLSYRVALGYENDAVQWGPTTRLELRPDEPADGIDNDDDRFVDETRIFLVRDVGTEEQTEADLGGGVRALLEGELANGLDDNGNGLVDEPGLCFALEGQSIVIRLSVEGRDTKGNVMVRTVTSSVRPRN